MIFFGKPVSTFPDHALLPIGMKFDRGVSAVAKRLVLRLTAPAQRHPIAPLVCKTVGGDQSDPATQPNRSAAVFYRILDQSDRNRLLAFKRRSARLVPSHKAPGRTIVDLPQQHGADREIDNESPAAQIIS